ncbi:hypothetical protein MASR2M36_33690 [Providencia sp.]
MSIQKSLPNYETLDKLLQQHSIALTTAEIHGLITGLICGVAVTIAGKHLSYDLANDGLAFPQTLAQPLRDLFDTTFESLDDSEFAFTMLFPDEDASVF